jgi:hypothetical protein
MELVSQMNLPFAFMAALILIIGFLLWRTQRNLGRQEPIWNTHDEPPEKPVKPGHHLGASEELVQWEVEMHDMARDLSGQLDSKMSALQHLIREADRAASRLETALEAIKREQAPRPMGSSAVANDTPPLAPTPRMVMSQADSLRTPKVSDEPVASSSATATKPSDRPSADRRYEEIYLLADYGFSQADIAQRVSMPIGEIQLILSLRSKR